MNVDAVMDVDTDGGSGLVMDVEPRAEGGDKRDGEGCVGG